MEPGCNVTPAASGQEMRKPSRHPGSVFGPSAADSVTVSRRRAGSAAHGCSSKEVRLNAATPGTPESLIPDQQFSRGWTVDIGTNQFKLA